MRHGGDLSAASRSFGRAESDWLDLSTGINPRPWPLAGAERTALAGLSRLPSPAALDALFAAARYAYRVPAALAVVAAPGTEVLIRLLPAIVAGRTLLLDTSYRSYGEAWRNAPGAALAPACLAEIAADPAGNVVVVNPNNPDGRRLPPEDLLRLARSRRGGIVVVDEAYADTEDDASIVPHLAPDDPVLVLKSFGKFFGLPGLRLGFAVGAPDRVASLAARLGDWPVSAPALAVGTQALADADWQGAARRWLAGQSDRLAAVLREAGLASAGGCRLFRLAGCEDAAALHQRLARAGIWTRLFDDRPGLLRIGLPADDAGLERLAEALRAA